MTRSGSFAWIAAFLLAAAIVSLAVVLRDVPAPFAAPPLPSAATRHSEPLVSAEPAGTPTVPSSLESRLETLSRGLVAARGAGGPARPAEAQFLPFALVLLGGIGLGAAGARLVRRRGPASGRPMPGAKAAEMTETTEPAAMTETTQAAEPAAVSTTTGLPAAFGRWLHAAGRGAAAEAPAAAADASRWDRPELEDADDDEDDDDDSPITAFEPNAVELRHRGGLLPWSSEARHSGAADPAVEQRLRALERTMLRLERKLDELTDPAPVAGDDEDESRLAGFSRGLARAERGGSAAPNAPPPAPAVDPGRLEPASIAAGTETTSDAARLRRAVRLLTDEGWTEDRIADRLDLEPAELLGTRPGSRRRRAS